MSMKKYVYKMQGATTNEHPQEVMRDFAREQGFEIVASRPQLIADCWEFWIEGDADLPDYIQESDADFMMDEPDEVKLRS